MSWGTGAWGTSAWGGTASPMSITGAVPWSTQRVRVTLTAPPRAVLASNVNDALNPSTWVLTRLDTSSVLTIAEVVKVSSKVFDLVLLEPMGSAMVRHRVRAAGMKAADGSTIVSPDDAFFLGVSLTTTGASAVQVSDLKNTGSISVGASGDYDAESGVALAKKMVQRVLTTAQGEFAHAPSFGAMKPLKGVLSPADLPGLKEQYERAVSSVSGVSDASAKLTLSGGVLTILVSATYTTGERFSVKETV